MPLFSKGNRRAQSTKTQADFVDFQDERKSSKGKAFAEAVHHAMKFSRAHKDESVVTDGDAGRKPPKSRLFSRRKDTNQVALIAELQEKLSKLEDRIAASKTTVAVVEASTMMTTTPTTDTASDTIYYFSDETKDSKTVVGTETSRATPDYAHNDPIHRAETVTPTTLDFEDWHPVDMIECPVKAVHLRRQRKLSNLRAIAVNDEVNSHATHLPQTANANPLDFEAWIPVNVIECHRETVNLRRQSKVSDLRAFAGDNNDVNSASTHHPETIVLTPLDNVAPTTINTQRPGNEPTETLEQLVSPARSQQQNNEKLEHNAGDIWEDVLAEEEAKALKLLREQVAKEKICLDEQQSAFKITIEKETEALKRLREEVNKEKSCLDEQLVALAAEKDKFEAIQKNHPSKDLMIERLHKAVSEINAAKLEASKEFSKIREERKACEEDCRRWKVTEEERSAFEREQEQLQKDKKILEEKTKALESKTKGIDTATCTYDLAAEKKKNGELQTQLTNAIHRSKQLEHELEILRRNSDADKKQMEIIHEAKLSELMKEHDDQQQEQEGASQTLADIVEEYWKVTKKTADMLGGRVHKQNGEKEEAPFHEEVIKTLLDTVEEYQKMAEEQMEERDRIAQYLTRFEHWKIVHQPKEKLCNQAEKQEGSNATTELE